MSPMNLIKLFALVAAVGFLAGLESEARALKQQELSSLARSARVDPNTLPYLMESPSSNREDQDLDSDDDDEDDERASNTRNQQNPLFPAGTDLFYSNKQIPLEQSYQKYNVVPSSSDLKVAASHHHKGHGTKGWLDMGAWTGKKGAFGWYDKHPVGKGK